MGFSSKYEFFYQYVLDYSYGKHNNFYIWFVVPAA